ncbi:MAG TPA: DNA-binding protein, partial [Nitrosomonas sp.]|nr:DNA-binding protein [Nitrosomonas sp.]
MSRVQDTNKIDRLLWYTAQELAGLPGMPETVSGVIRTAKKNLINNRRKMRGKGLEYHLLSLPTITQRYIAQHQDLFGSCAEFIQGVTPSPPIAAA